MTIDDDSFDIETYLEGTEYEKPFDRFMKWAYMVDKFANEVHEQNETLRKAMKILSEPLPEDDRPPRRDEVEISVPASDPARVGALGSFLSDDTARVDQGILNRYGLKGPLVLVSARRDGGLVRFRFRRP